MQTKRNTAIILTSILIFTIFTINPQVAQAKTHYVGTGGEYDTIQEAINNASTGDIIHIYSGIYYETINITIDGLTIQGENAIIDGTGSPIENSTVLIIDNNTIVIRDLIIRNSNNHGIYAQNANNIEISNCEIYDNDEHGISFYNVNNIDINNNEIYDNNNDGIRIVGTTIGNIENCEIYDNYESGILIDSSDNIDITSSEIYYNYDGIKLDDHTNNVTITFCNITDNEIGLSISSFCVDNTIYLNNFIDNYQNSVSYDTNTWDNGAIGNYWDDYTGDDDNSDGLGDTPYTLNGVNDNYPIVHMYGSVLNQNTGEIFLSIQAAIDDADTLSGHTIFVKEDTYYENIVVSKDGITIQGENKDTTIIDASNQNMNGVLIKNHDNVNIQGFTITNSPDSDIYKSNGVFIWAYSYISGSNHSNSNTISDCIIEDNGKHGILIYGSNVGQINNNNVITDCEIFDNGYSGIRITNDYEGGGYSTADSNQIINCELYDNGFYGVLDHEEAAISISPDGQVTNTLIKDCLIYYSNGYDIHITTGETVENNIIHHNNFLSNTDNTYDEGTNLWYDSTLQEGNYWTCYDEPSEGAYDTEPNGIIDTPYNIWGGSNQDLYPLAEPIGMSRPVADTNGPYSAYVDASITFDGTSSTHPDGLSMQYLWEFGNGEWKYGSTATYAYPVVGEYTITLTVEDEYGLTSTATTTATITEEPEEPEEPPEEPENELPVANAGGPYYEFAGVPILFDGSDSYDIDGPGVSYAWNFGDGNTGSQQTPTHTYPEKGNYTVTLTVTDEDGATNSDTTTAIITLKPNNPPEKPIANGTKTGHINISYNFTFNASDPDNDTIQYIINWDDGTNETNSSIMNSSEQFNTSHNWTKGGVYIITAYVKDKHNSTSDTQQFKVIIDAHKCGSLGYLVDKNGDGEYNVFYRETTNRETPIEKNSDEYNIDINNDEKWDYIYNFTTSQVRNYPNPTDEKIDEFTIETKWIILFVFIFAALILGIAKYAIYRSKTPKKKPKKKPKKISKKKLDKKTKKPKKKKTKKKTKKPKSKKKKMKKAEKEIDKFLSKNESKKKK